MYKKTLRVTKNYTFGYVSNEAPLSFAFVKYVACFYWAVHDSFALTRTGQPRDGFHERADFDVNDKSGFESLSHVTTTIIYHRNLKMHDEDPTVSMYL